MDDDAYIGRLSENNIKCVMHDDLGRKNQTTRYILLRHWLYGWFSSFIVVELIRFFHGALQLIMTLVHLIMSFRNISLFCVLLHTYLKWQGHLEFLWKCVLSYAHATTSRTLNLAWYTAGGREGLWGWTVGLRCPQLLGPPCMPIPLAL